MRIGDWEGDTVISHGSRCALMTIVDRRSKFLFMKKIGRKTMKNTNHAIVNSLKKHKKSVVPYKIHTILTDNGQQFTNLEHQKYEFPHVFDRVCKEHNIEHRKTQPAHPWTNGHVERMNKTIKEATLKRYHYSSHDQLHEHLKTFIDAYNFAKRLKTLNGLTPYEFIINQLENSPTIFKINPSSILDHTCWLFRLFGNIDAGGVTE
ncbi:MAG: integrase core domain-containing protein [Holosporaceae bacterium]|nr:integrase core domain-containing protein [Holosporaceae bacterium]